MVRTDQPVPPAFKPPPRPSQSVADTPESDQQHQERRAEDGEQGSQQFEKFVRHQNGVIGTHSRIS